jgi:hypothetical protein
MNEQTGIKEKPKSKKKDIVRVGDIVIIENPNFFLRCGYPLSINEVRKDVLTKYKDEIDEFVKTIVANELPSEYKNTNGDVITIGDCLKDHEVDSIVKVIAYKLIKAKGFGGENRSIHTVEKKELKGAIRKVAKIKMCVTGNYYPPSPSIRSSCYSYEDEYDYSPGGLDNQKNNKILYLEPITEGDSGIFNLKKHVSKCDWIPDWVADWENLDSIRVEDKEYKMAIEACNVRKIQK